MEVGCLGQLQLQARFPRLSRTMKLWKPLPSQQEAQERRHTYLFSASRFPIQPPLSRTWTKKLVHFLGCWNQSKHSAFYMSYGRYCLLYHPHGEVNRKPVGALDMKTREWRSAVVKSWKGCGRNVGRNIDRMQKWLQLIILLSLC